MLTYNNTKIETLKFGNTDIETGIFNGVMVFEKRQDNNVILRTTKPTVLLTVATKEGLDVDVWNAGEKVAVLKHGIRTEVLLKDTGQDIIIKGHDIIKLYCTESQLTSLNVQELTALQWLDCNNNQLTSLNMQGLTTLQELGCSYNQLTASTFKDIFINLAKTKGGGDACLYYDYDSNYKDFTQPPELARAFNAAKAKGWKFYKNSKNDENLL